MSSQVLVSCKRAAWSSIHYKGRATSLQNAIRGGVRGIGIVYMFRQEFVENPTKLYMYTSANTGSVTRLQEELVHNNTHTFIYNIDKFILF